MHIKQITISNFRSFRQQPEIEAFSTHTNCVVGRNGSGKSNLLDAVQFVLLAPRFANLRQEERQALLHEGSGSAAVNAFVEIVFDNADHRFALEHSDEVVLRRTVGLKKDEFFLQRKRVTKQEVQSLLEGAGFSRSNPYYIVQQGKVQDLCTMSDVERLRLLKEVAGTVVYDQKKTESLAKMQENGHSITKIQEILDDIEAKLDELQAEKEELTAYQALDRQRRALQYVLYDKQLRKARHDLDQLEHARTSHVQNLSALHEELKDTHEAIRNKDAVLKTKTNALRRNQTTLEAHEQDKTSRVTDVTRLQLECQELLEAVRSGAEQLQSNEKELEAVQAEIEASQTNLRDTVQPAYDQAVAVLQDLTTRRDEASRQVESLYAKQGRGQHFQTVQDRDAFLQSSVEELLATQRDKTSAVQAQQDTLANLRRSVTQETTEIDKLTSQLTSQAAGLQSLSKTIEETKRQRLELHDARKEAWREAEALHDQVREARGTFQRAKQDTAKVMPRATAMGLKALTSVVEQEGLTSDQYFGMLMDNFVLRDDKYQTAVEVAAQNALFHVVVDTDVTASRLMKRLEADKLGRVTFLPLNQLRIDQPNLPQSNDIRPMLDLCLQYDRKVERALQHVFGKKLLARTPEIASEWSAQHGVDAITLDGDLCSRKGALTGGYVDTSKSRLRAHAKQTEAQAALQNVETLHQGKSREAEQVEQQVTNLMQELQRQESKQAELSRMVQGKEMELDRIQTRLENHKKQVETVEKTLIPPLERDIVALNGDMDRLKAEMGTPLTQTLSDEDRKLLATLKETQTRLVAEIESQSDKVAQVGLDRQKLQSLLDDNLLKRQRELREGGVDGRRRQSHGRLSSAAVQAEQQEELAECQRRLDDALRVKDEIEGRLEESRRVDEELRGEIIVVKNELEQLKSEYLNVSKRLEEAQNETERLMNKRSMCISTREEKMRSIRELGSLPPPAELDKHSGKSTEALKNSIEGVNKKLKKYSHINNKAFDQYINFSEQRESLLVRKAELDQGAEKVEELVSSLDQQKDEAINRTFRGVSAHFKDVFEELVPNGAGELILRTAMDEAMEDDANDTDQDDDSVNADSPKKAKDFDANNPDVNLYRGIGIQVRFSAVGENYLMSQLSGGQKALVSLALIFAIQRCDPAPFYILDELDQALDASYRAAVANLIQKQATSTENPTQFIVSTFRPELVAIANRCYGISLQNKVSRIHPLSKKDALHFIANLMHEEEATGEVATVGTSSKATASRWSRDSRKRKSQSAAAVRLAVDEDTVAEGVEDPAIDLVGED
jgi:structural maintenance of chromosome 3 (chondroitin sulfate proteoglycan 6)